VRPLTNRQRKLVADNYRLATAFVTRKLRKKKLSPTDQDEVEQIIAIGIMKAAKKWRRKYKVPFWRYARLQIYFAWWKWTTESARKCPDHPILAAIPTAHQNHSIDDIDAFFWDDMAFYMKKAGLNQREKDVIYARFRHRKTLLQCAKLCALSIERIRQIEKGALQKLRACLGQ
jgi:RNA polymerase sigma factor (sigma-70 family)